jgi:hypothetical protein
MNTDYKVKIATFLTLVEQAQRWQYFYDRFFHSPTGYDGSMFANHYGKKRSKLNNMNHVSKMVLKAQRQYYRYVDETR